ncbi:MULTISPECIES: CAP domain-containing protein [unclassified Burkholderia]|uniref:CAP domain-containing protein n=1 Tax=unclassified Burkholderia TaxID=2613784 RepID=UPI002AB0A0FA|nr:MULTISPECIES: CAP domain-containing protein [unclassified Burkholderia]
MKNNKNISRPSPRSSHSLAATLVAALTAALCTGCASVKDAGSNPPALPANQTADTANVSPAQYKAGTPQAVLFETLNAMRVQCGFPAYTENLALDAAAQAHSAYMVVNDGTVVDSEVPLAKGFVGATYAERAAKYGFPSGSVGVGGVANSYMRSTELTDEQYGQAVLAGWVSGVYHAFVVASPLTQIGIGWGKITLGAYPKVLSDLTVSNLQPIAGDLPLTFPCEGSTGVPHTGFGETPTPPGTEGAWGSPIALSGSPWDVLRLTTGTMTDASGRVVELELLDSSTDVNHEVEPYAAVAYPSKPLMPLSSYTATIAGTVNGKPFTRHFTFHTGA